jgi:hypothetical protein
MTAAKTEAELPELPPIPKWMFKPGAVGYDFVQDYARSYATAAVLQERERCAKLCKDVEAAADDCWDLTADPASQGESIGATKCAAAIRAQKEPT